MMVVNKLTGRLLVLGMMALLLPAGIEAQIFEAPRLEDITIDGQSDDWGGKGMPIDVLRPPFGKESTSVDSLSVRARIGWNDRGILLLITVNDDKWIEHEKLDWLWRYDGVEVFMAPKAGVSNVCQWVITPGMTDAQPQLRLRTHDHRKDPELRKLSTTISAARSKTAGGYVMEILVPLVGVGIKSQLNSEVGLQFWINDADEKDGSTYHATWFPADNSANEPANMHRVRLTSKAGPGTLTRGEYNYLWKSQECRVVAISTPEHDGKDVSLVWNNEVLATGVLKKSGGHASVELVASLPFTTELSRELRIRMKGSVDSNPEWEESENVKEDVLNSTDAQLFSALNLSLPGLERVRAAVDKEDYARAYRAWGRYIAHRKAPVWYVNNQTYGPGMKKKLPAISKVILENCVPALENRLAKGGVPLCYTDGKPDFTRNPKQSTNLISLWNLGFLEPLARAYLLSGEAKYAKAYQLYTRALFDQRNSRPTFGLENMDYRACWIELNTSLRILHFTDAYMCMRQYEGLTAKDHEVALKLIYACGELLADGDRYNQHATTPNQRLVGMCTLGILGIMFPEFNNGEEWRIRGTVDALATLKRTVYADGAHVEICSQYHMCAIRDPAKLSLVMSLNGYEGMYGKGDGADVFRSLHSWIVPGVGPDGFFPPLHSGVFCTEWLAYLMIYEYFNPGTFTSTIEKFYSEEYVPVAKGAPGDTIIVLTPDFLPEVSKKKRELRRGCYGSNSWPSGLTSMQSGSDPDSTFLVTLNGKPLEGHGYPQLGSFVLYGRGKWLALHPGSPFDYGHPQYVSYFHSTMSHNTVLVDGLNQVYRASTNSAWQTELGGVCDAWVESTDACIMRTTHEGYKTINGILHTRTFFMLDEGWVFIHDYLRAEKSEDRDHTFDWELHTQETLSEGAQRILESDAFAVIPAYADEIKHIDHQVKPGMIPVRFDEGLKKQESTVNQYYLRKTGPSATFGVALIPLKKDEKPMTVKPLSPVTDRHRAEAFEVVGPRGHYVLLLNNGDTKAVTATVSGTKITTTEPAAAARIEEGKVLWFVEGKKPQ